MLTADQILAVEDLQHADIEVPEWGGTVRVRVMSGAERGAFEASFMQVGKLADMESISRTALARLVVFCAVDEQGNRVFTAEQVEALSKKSSVALARVAEAARRLNAMSQADIEDMGKLFAAIQGGASTSS